MQKSINRKTMAKIKSCTDIPQSKILANILLPETADLCYYPNIKGGAGTYDPTPEFTDEILPDELPCWSLNALIDVLPNYEIYNHGNEIQLDVNRIALATEGDETLLDLVVNMIIDLHKQKLL